MACSAKQRGPWACGAGVSDWRSGPYREPIARGIEFLVKFVGKDGSAVKDGETMYSQGLAALTLAEPLDRMMLRAK